jgi:hypothetical protein
MTKHTFLRPTRFLAAAGVALALAAGSTGAAQTVSAGPPAHWCECVEYVKNYFGLRGTAGNAKDMGPFLAARGFQRSTTPAVGDVVLIQPAFYDRGSGATYGHSAIVESLARAGGGGWFLGLRSANQTGKQFAGANCSNVTFKSVGPVSRTSRLASYWVPPRG